MTIEQALNAIYRGDLVESTKEDWPKMRSMIQTQAATYLDTGDPMRAMIALQEIKRLDAKFAEDEDAC